MADDLRRYERISIDLPVRLYIPGDNGDKGLRFEAFADSLDLGLGGLFVRSSFLMREGVKLVVELSLRDGILPLRGVVAHLVELDGPSPSGMGIEFLDVDKKSRETLLRYFVPERYHRFFEDLVGEFPHLERDLPLPDIALILNLWEEWKVKSAGGPATSTVAALPSARRAVQGRR
jgi:hypothetical protein